MKRTQVADTLADDIISQLCPLPCPVYAVYEIDGELVDFPIYALVLRALKDRAIGIIAQEIEPLMLNPHGEDNKFESYDFGARNFKGLKYNGKMDPTRVEK